MSWSAVVDRSTGSTSRALSCAIGEVQAGTRRDERATPVRENVSRQYDRGPAALAGSRAGGDGRRTGIDLSRAMAHNQIHAISASVTAGAALPGSGAVLLDLPGIGYRGRFLPVAMPAGCTPPPPRDLRTVRAWFPVSRHYNRIATMLRTANTFSPSATRTLVPDAGPCRGALRDR